MADEKTLFLTELKELLARYSKLPYVYLNKSP